LYLPQILQEFWQLSFSVGL